MTKDTMSYSMLSTCTFIQTMLKWTPVNQRERERREREKRGRRGENRRKIIIYTNKICT